jgi:hypothetical protein
MADKDARVEKEEAVVMESTSGFEEAVVEDAEVVAEKPPAEAAAPAEESPKDHPKPVSLREERLASMAEARRGQVVESVIEGGGEAPVFGAGEEADAAETDENETEKPAHITLKVNGAQKVVAPGTILRALGIDEDRAPTDAEVRIYQKDLAADEKMRRAKEIEQQNLSRPAQPAPSQADAQNTAPSEKDVHDDNADLARNVVAGLYSGNEDEAISAFRKALPSADELVGRTVQAIEAERAKREKIEAYNSFAEKFEDLATDEHLFALAASNAQKVADLHPDWGPAKVFIEAGNVTYEGLGRKPKTPPGPIDRAERKRSTPTPVRGQNATAPQRPTGPKIPNARESLDQMRVARGQPSLL